MLLAQIRVLKALAGSVQILGPNDKEFLTGYVINLNGLLERESSCKKQEWDNELRKDIHSK